MKDRIENKSTMIEPGINSLLTKVDSRYTLVVATAKRANNYGGSS